MGVLNTVFSVFLSRDQRERHSRSKWEKSVAQAARDLGLDAPQEPSYIVSPPPPPTPTSRAPKNLHLITSCPRTPSLSSASSSGTSSGINSGINSPAISRPGTSCSSSPGSRPEVFRRHTSIARNPISYDSLISLQKPENPRRASSDAARSKQQLLYALPPLGPMEGVGKYRRSVHVTEDFLNTQQRNVIAALQPLDLGEDRVARFHRRENKDTTTPPRAYSTSPNEKEIARRHLGWQPDVERWQRELQASAEAEAEDNFEDVPEEEELEVAKASTPVRVVSNPRRPRQARNTKARVGAAAPVRKSSGRPAHQQVGANRNAKKGGYKGKAAPQKAPMSASMETLVSGEE